MVNHASHILREIWKALIGYQMIAFCYQTHARNLNRLPIPGLAGKAGIAAGILGIPKNLFAAVQVPDEETAWKVLGSGWLDGVHVVCILNEGREAIVPDEIMSSLRKIQSGQTVVVIGAESIHWFTHPGISRLAIDLLQNMVRRQDTILVMDLVDDPDGSRTIQFLSHNRWLIRETDRAILLAWRKGTLIEKIFNIEPPLRRVFRMISEEIERRRILVLQQPNRASNAEKSYLYSRLLAEIVAEEIAYRIHKSHDDTIAAARKFVDQELMAWMSRARDEPLWWILRAIRGTKTTSYRLSG